MTDKMYRYRVNKVEEKETYYVRTFKICKYKAQKRKK